MIKKDVVQYVSKAFRWGQFVNAQLIEVKLSDLHGSGRIDELITRWNREGSTMSAITGLTWQYQAVDPKIPVKMLPVVKHVYVNWSKYKSPF